MYEVDTAEPDNSVPAIRVSGLSKTYPSIDEGPTRNAALNNLILLLHQVLGFRSGATQFQALQDLSFDVPPGTALGIIGGNGSGKSTLLKVIARVTPPSTGTIELNGRVVSLLEMGFGFRDDLSGRDNVLMSAALYDVDREQAKAFVDEIVEFAGIGRFIDMPVRTYSSGMYLRLAFATAIHMDPDIILADEVLAVGDVRFRNKCLRKLQDLKAEGKTLLYVSHDLSEIRRVADQVLWLHEGEVRAYGDVDEVVDSYLAEMQEEGVENLPAVTWDSSSEGTPPIAIEGARMTTPKGSKVDVIEYNKAYYIQLQVRSFESGIRIYPRIDVSRGDVPIGQFAPLDAIPVEAKKTIDMAVKLPRYFFNTGRYMARISVEVVREDKREVVTVDQALGFSVVTPYEAGLPYLFENVDNGPIHPLFLTRRCVWEVLGHALPGSDEGDGDGEEDSGVRISAADLRKS